MGGAIRLGMRVPGSAGVGSSRAPRRMVPSKCPLELPKRRGVLWGPSLGWKLATGTGIASVQCPAEKKLPRACRHPEGGRQRQARALRC